MFWRQRRGMSNSWIWVDLHMHNGPHRSQHTHFFSGITEFVSEEVTRHSSPPTCIRRQNCIGVVCEKNQNWYSQEYSAVLNPKFTRRRISEHLCARFNKSQYRLFFTSCHILLYWPALNEVCKIINFEHFWNETHTAYTKIQNWSILMFTDMWM